MSTYVMLARKWRPAQFKDIVGQTQVVRTLMNAIEASRIHQAYLFTGSRGIGKTSIARIFAKAVRCEGANWRESWLYSCDTCSSCKEITASTSVDVIEIDGASNNGVDAIRDIRENAKYLPAVGSKKIYIIDEVHMLTTAAFNALLKTLEEPPAHVIFIFATTEPHKIPTTILSRCQRFDFKRVTPVQVQNRMQEVLQAEGVSAEAGAIALIARAAEGSMRDALSILDQVIAFSGSSITLESARTSMGVVESQTVLGTLKAVLQRQPLAATELITQAYDQGHDLKVLTKSLIEALYGVILAQLGSSAPRLLEASPEEWAELQSLAPLRPLEELELIFQILHHGLDSIARSPQPKITLDILLIKCASAEVLVGATELPTHVQTTSTPVAPTSASPSFTSKHPGHEQKSGAQTWEGFVDLVKQSRPLLATVLEHAVTAELPINSSALTIVFSPVDSYRADQVKAKNNSDELHSLAKGYFGKLVSVQTALKEGMGQSLAQRREQEREKREHAIHERVQNHPIIQEAKALFGGTLGPIEITSGHEKGEMAP